METTTVLEVRANHNRHVVCMLSRGPKITRYIGLEGVALLNVHQMENDKFEHEYFKEPTKRVAGEDIKYTPADFAAAYMRNESARKMIPIAPVALRALAAIIRGQVPAEGQPPVDPTLSDSMEKIMATAKDEGFRKPDGPVAKVHKFLDGKYDAIKKGVMSRKECIEALVAKGIVESTAVTQAGVWARTNSVSFARPAAAAEKKAAGKAKAKKKAKA